MSEGSAEIPNPLAAAVFPPALVKLRGLAALVGLACLVLSCFMLIPALGGPAEFFRSWLFAYLFWISIGTGAMGMVMISHCSGGGWGVLIRRIGEACFTTLPIMFVFFLPFILGYKYLFPWAHPLDFRDRPELYERLLHRQPWFTPFWFTIRNFVYFAVWTFWAWKLRSGSLKLDQKDDPILRRRLRKWCAGGIVLYFIIVTSFAMDFVLSREIHFVSSIIGFIMAIGWANAGMAFMVLVISVFGSRFPLNRIAKPQFLNDIGNLQLALIILWIYTAFAQLLVIWTGNTREDIGYYTHRGLGMQPNPWRWVAVTLLVGHFFTPFLLLLQKPLKRKLPTMAMISALILAMRIVDNLWLTAPSGPFREPGGIYWTDPLLFLGIGGIWIYFFLGNLGAAPLVALHTSRDPSSDESRVEHGIATHSAHAL